MSDLTSLTQLSAAWLLTYALHSTLFLGLAWLVSRRLAKRMPRVEEAVWRFALVAALATASLQLAAGFRPLAGSWGLTVPAVSEASEAAAPALVDLTPMVSQASSPRVAVPDRALRAPSPLRIPAGTAPAGPVTSKLPVSIPMLLMGLWALGALLLSARWVAGHLLLRRRLRPRPEVVGGNMFSQFISLLGEAGLDGPVRLTCSSRLSVPIALGLSRREVCVPPKALASLAPEEQEGMLAHELAHLVRRDPFWLAFSRILASVFFFQPLNWVAYRRMREISELLCDEWAIDRTGRPLSLARCLAEVAGWSFHPVEAQAAPGMADRPSHLAHRIRRLLDGGRTPERRVHPAWLIAGMIVLLVAVAAVAPGVYAAAQDPQAEPAVVEPDEEDEEDEGSPIDEEDMEALAEEHMEELAEDVADDLDDLADEMAELGDLDELAQLGELADLDALAELEAVAELADLDMMGDLDELAALSDEVAQEIGERSSQEMEAAARRYEQMAREMSERIETQLAPQMRELERKMTEQMKLFEQSPEMKRLHERAKEIAEQARPSDEEMARLHAEIEKLRQDGGMSSEEKERIREQARQMAEKYRMTDAEREEMRKLARESREMSRKFNEEHRAEMEKMRREILQQTQAIREEIRRQMENDPQMRELRERHRRDHEQREEIRKEHRERHEQIQRRMQQNREEVQRRREADRDRTRQRMERQRDQQKQLREQLQKEREQRLEELRKKSEQDQEKGAAILAAWPEVRIAFAQAPGVTFVLSPEDEAQLARELVRIRTIDYEKLAEQAFVVSGGR